MKGGQRHRLVEHADLVGDPKRANACTAGELRRHDTLDGAIVEEPKAFIDGWWTHQGNLAIFHPISAPLVQLVDRLTGGKTQRCASYLLALKRHDSGVVSHEQARDHLIQRIREEESPAAKL